MKHVENLSDLTLDDLAKKCNQLGVQTFRAKQIYNWIYHNYVTSFKEMTNIPKELISVMSNNFTIDSIDIKQSERSQDGTEKFLFELSDGENVETVLMQYNKSSGYKRFTVCVSTQVGCNIGCSFCATAQGGLKRNLTAGEIVGQVLIIQRELQKKDRELRVSNVVFMGMGEPLANYENVLRSVKILSSQEGLNISLRKITISTSGIVPKIKRLASENIPIVLAISLHAANNELRNQLVPINKKYPLEHLINACAFYVSKTNRRVTIEYIMLSGVNDSKKDAKELAILLKDLLVNVNLIPYNSVVETEFNRTDKYKLVAFVQELKANGIEAIVREEKGTDISAACGQLRRKHSNLQ